MFKYSLAFLLITSISISAAQPTIQVQERLFGETNDWIFFTVTTDGKGIKLVPLDSGLDFFPTGKLKDPNEQAVKAKKAGTYRLLIYTGSADGPSEPKIIQVIVGGVLPPSPNPDPITPPQPKIDPLLKSLKDTYNAETAVDKQERIRVLASAMKEASKYATDTTIGTNEALVKKVSTLTTTKLGDNLLSLRKIIGAHLGNEFPKEVVTLDKELRERFSKEYTKIATYLEEISNN